MEIFHFIKSNETNKVWFARRVRLQNDFENLILSVDRNLSSSTLRSRSRDESKEQINPSLIRPSWNKIISLFHCWIFFSPHFINLFYIISHFIHVFNFQCFAFLFCDIHTFNGSAWGESIVTERRTDATRTQAPVFVWSCFKKTRKRESDRFFRESYVRIYENSSTSVPDVCDVTQVSFTYSSEIIIGRRKRREKKQLRRCVFLICWYSRTRDYITLST